ncbi:MAG: HAD hydrolase family protein [Candidatus Pacebacteria bacterium]|nr:HAD hydrolase family protein [Candidatus Paceibacterota bacterium]
MTETNNRIFVDIDGCLLSQDANVCLSDYQSLFWLAQKIQKAKIGMFPKITFCSGRNRNCVEMIACLLGLPDCFSVIENGIALFNPLTKELILSPDITPRIKRLFLRTLRKRVARILKNHPGMSLCYGNLVGISIERIRSVEGPLDLDQMRKVIRGELNYFVKRRMLRVIRLYNSISVFPANINKGTGLEFLAEREGIDLKRSIGIGDAKEDIPFLRKLRLIGCPVNASLKCKELVREKRGRISPFANTQGVVDIIKYFMPQED